MILKQSKNFELTKLLDCIAPIYYERCKKCDNGVDDYLKIRGLNPVPTCTRFYLSFKPTPNPNMAATKAR